MNNRELVAETESRYIWIRNKFPLFYEIFFYQLKYSVAESGNDNPRRAFDRIKRSVRSRSAYRKLYILNPLTCPRSVRGVVELNDFGGRFADLKESVAACAKEKGLRLIKNDVNVKHGWRGKKAILLGRTFSFEHLAFSTPRLEQLLSAFAIDGLSQENLEDVDTIVEIETILGQEISWLTAQLIKNNVKAIFLHDDQRPAPALLCAAARKAGVTTVTVRHGYIGWSQAHSSSLPLNSDHFIVWSEFEAQRIHELYPEYCDRVHSFGFPGLQKPMEELLLDPPPIGGKILTYICGPLWFMKERFGDDLRATLWDVRKAVEAAGYDFVLRLHWKDRQRDPDEEFSEILEEFQTSGASLLEDFERSSAIAASYVSSALLEASAYGRWAINITEGEFEIPWADNVSLRDVSSHLLRGECGVAETHNAFRREEFEAFLINLLR